MLIDKETKRPACSMCRLQSDSIAALGMHFDCVLATGFVGWHDLEGVRRLKGMVSWAQSIADALCPVLERMELPLPRHR